MGDNKEERKKMKKTRYVALVLLSSLLTLVGCSRREILDDYPVTGINIRLDWEGVTGRLPEGVRVIFYPKDTQGRKIDTYLPAKGGEMKVPPGHYLAVIYNYDTEVVQVKGEDSYETIMACTGNCTGLGDSETENMVWGPDNFLCGNPGRCRNRKRRRVTDTRGKTKICGNHLHLFNKDRGAEKCLIDHWQCFRNG